MSENGTLFGPPKLVDVTIVDKIKELERELKMRHVVYPHLVDRGRMSREESAKRILILRSVLADYKAAQARS